MWVFGGAGYLGQDCVRSLHAQGARVVCIDRPGRAEAFADEAALGERLVPHSLDLTDTEAVRRWMSDPANPAADAAIFLTTPGGPNAPFMELSEGEFDEYNHLGLTCLFLAVREAAERMLERGGGSVVLFSSMYGVVSPDPRIYHAPMQPNPMAYGMHKAAILQMTRYLGVMWGPRNVRVNAVVPGPFPNPPQQAADPAFIERLTGKVPMGRIGRQHEIAGAVTYLAADASSYVTGQSITVDGGWTAW